MPPGVGQDGALLYYRAWRGQFRSPAWGIWPIARVGLGLLFRRRLFWFLYVLGLLIFLLFFFGSYLLDWVETQVPATPIQIGRFQAEPDRIVRTLRQGLRVLNGSNETFAYFFLYQGLIVKVVLTLAGAVLVGNDYTYRSLPFYLSKPLSRWHYLLGKGLAAAVVVTLLTTLPAVLLFVQHGLSDWDYFTDADYFLRNNNGAGPAGLPLLGGVLAYGLLLMGFLSLLLVA